MKEIKNNILAFLGALLIGLGLATAIIFSFIQDTTADRLKAYAAALSLILLGLLFAKLSGKSRKEILQIFFFSL